MPEKRGPGRPASYGQRRNIVLRVRVTSDEERTIAEKAAEVELTVAEWLYHKATGKRMPPKRSR